MDPPSIVDSVVNLDKFSSVSDRYYEHKYCIRFTTSDTNCDQRVSFHSNRICLISLAEFHPVLKNKKNVVKINCTVGKENRSLNAASGKSKHGAQKLEPTSVLCYIECDDGETYPVYSCVKGKLLEINENLLKNPNLLVEKPTSEGYIALVLPVLNLYENLKKNMLSKEDYFYGKEDFLNEVKTEM